VYLSKDDHHLSQDYDACEYQIEQC